MKNGVKKTALISIVSAVFTLLLAATAFAGQASIENVTADRNTLEQYELYEVEVSVSASYKNPYDPDEIDLVAHITTPDGSLVAIPAFFAGKGSPWKIRFAPRGTGRYSYYLTLETPSESDKSDTYHFDVTRGTGDGFLKKSENSPPYPVFDSGKPFFGIGHNIAWVTDNSVSTFEKYFEDFKENGCNMTRIWINSAWALNIENTKVGVYNLADCDKLDALLELAEEYGVYIQLTLDSYGSLMEEAGPWGEQAWSKNPYNRANGGPCEKPEDFFTLESAKKHYKNRLRYIISRWSYSPNVFAFELWNEYDVPREWAAEMFSYMRSVSPHGQFLTTSLGYPWGNNFDESVIWGMEDIDIIQRHVFANDAGDVSENLISVTRKMLETYNKYVLVSEFGLHWSKSDKEIDGSGDAIELHNSIWASALSGSFASAMNWWWADYIRAKNLYPHYKALRNFLEGTNWNSRNTAPVKTGPIMRGLSPGEEISYSDVTISTKEVWGDTSFKEFTINSNGDVSGGVVNHYLHGYLKKQFKIDFTFHLDYPIDGKFIIHVGMVSQGGNLVAHLDDKEVLSKEFPVGEGVGPWQRSLFRKDEKIYQCVYNTTVEIDVPKGEHTLQLTNTGKDWIGIKKIVLANYTDNTFADARVAGITVGDEMLLWIQNKGFNWRDIKKGKEPSTIAGASFDILGVEDGVYNVEWWDTFEGKIASGEKLTAENNALHISIPAFQKDLACKVKR